MRTHPSLFVPLAFLGLVLAPEASTAPSYTSDLNRWVQDHGRKDNGSHGLMTHGLPLGS